MAGMSQSVTDDLFDSIIMADDRFHVDGYHKGFEEGMQQGLIEGRNHGMLHGAKLSAEVSFYHGFALTWKCLLQNTEDVKARKRLKAVETLDAMIQTFPYEDPQYENLQENMERVRAKFRQLAKPSGWGQREGARPEQMKEDAGRFQKMFRNFRSRWRVVT